jgi:uncharacterized protein (DUF2141 family)
MAIAYFQYYYKAKSSGKSTTFLFTLKSISLFLLLLLIINPKIKTSVVENIKPTLSLLVDNSKSISFFKEEQNVIDFLSKLNNNSALSKKFDFQKFVFSEALIVSDSLSFNGSETNIHEAISSASQLNTANNGPILLFTDGNQTIGQDYEFINSKQKVHPIIFGDTTKYTDVQVSQVNVNNYSYLKNKFPVEVLLNYDGNEEVNTKFSIFKGNKTVFSKNIQFSKKENSQIIATNLSATKEGSNYYTATIQKIKDEKNTQNNSKNFSVEVIDEQTKVLIITSVLHPDIGALKKAIESNKQRTVVISNIDDFKGQISNFELIICYQPNELFNTVLSDVKQLNSNFVLISGPNASWNFINKQQLGFTKKAINQTENYEAVYNASFLTFLQKDIGFNTFTPLSDQFGEVTFSKDHQEVLFQNINGLETAQPLITVLEENNQKTAVIFGEGIWKWRASSFLSTNSFQDFDQFIGNLVQYVSAKKKRNRLTVTSENLYAANGVVQIAAFYTDKNYQFDGRASLTIEITNKQTKEVTKLPLSLINNAYQIAIENLNSGEYNFKVGVLGQEITKSGSFKITAYSIEKQFTHANVDKLKKLATTAGGKLFFKNESDKLMKYLMADKTYFTLQKASIKEHHLIDLKWVLLLVTLLFITEWLLRKYLGKI